MPTLPCDSQWHLIVRLTTTAAGFGGTVRIARSNAWRRAVRVIAPPFFGELSRFTCPRRCRRSRWPRNNNLPYRFGPAVRRADGTFRVECTLDWKGWVKCRPQISSLAMATTGFQSIWIGPFAEKEDCVESQQAAVPPVGGGKSGFFWNKPSEEDALAQGFYYAMYLPEGGAGGLESDTEDAPIGLNFGGEEMLEPQQETLDAVDSLPEPALDEGEDEEPLEHDPGEPR